LCEALAGPLVFLEGGGGGGFVPIELV